MKKTLFPILLFLCSAALLQARTDEHVLHVLTTGDVHGSIFSTPYEEDGTGGTSLMAVKKKVDAIRESEGRDNVLLLDAGDFLQGDNSVYYFNRVATDRPHIWSRVAAYMGYDAITAGNHDIEAGHEVYDRVRAELEGYGIPLLAANALKDDGKPYFREYAVFRRAGLKILVMGFENPNISAWVSPEMWSGMEFKSLVPFVQEAVERVQAREHPQVTIVVTHSGTGKGDGSELENQGLDLYQSLHGVDLLVCAHDHRPAVKSNGTFALVNAGSHARNIGHGMIKAVTKGNRVISKSVSASIERIDKKDVDTAMRDTFTRDFEDVRAFTLTHVGKLMMPLRTRDAYAGMSDYINLLHMVSLSGSGAKISFAAPLTFNGYIEQGDLNFNDMFRIYPYENQLFVMNLKGSEIKAYLEYSYDSWIQTPGDHVLRISNRPDPRTGARKWSFEGRPYNFDSAAGLIYTVDVSKPAGSRIIIQSLADGSPFNEDETYPVALTSYRANGGGSIITKGAGIRKEDIPGRIIARGADIRQLVYEFIKARPALDKASINDTKLLGFWKFIPSGRTDDLIGADLDLIF